MRFSADENFDGRILNGLRARLPELDIMRVQDTEMYQSADANLLIWLAENDRILITHDVRTMPRYVYSRVRAGQAVPGVIEVYKDSPRRTRNRDYCWHIRRFQKPSVIHPASLGVSSHPHTPFSP